MKRLQTNYFYTYFELQAFLKQHKYKYFAGIHGTDSYTNHETYISDGKLYNLLIGRRFWHGGAFLIKQSNGLKIYQNLGGYYVNTQFGVVYVNSLIKNKKSK